jgi:hypothetical protein
VNPSMLLLLAKFTGIARSQERLLPKSRMGRDRVVDSKMATIQSSSVAECLCIVLYCLERPSQRVMVRIEESTSSGELAASEEPIDEN